MIGRRNEEGGRKGGDALKPGRVNPLKFYSGYELIAIESKQKVVDYVTRTSTLSLFKQDISKE